MERLLLLDRSIEDVEKQLFRLNYQLKIDQGYVESPDADPSDIADIKLQIELNLVERERLERQLALLQAARRAAEAEADDASSAPRRTPPAAGPQDPV